MNGNSKLPRIIVGLLFLLVGLYISWNSSRNAKNAPPDTSAPEVSTAPEDPVAKKLPKSQPVDEETTEVAADSEDTRPVFGPKAKNSVSTPPKAGTPAKPQEVNRPLTVPKSLGNKAGSPASRTSGTPPPPQAREKPTASGRIVVQNVKVLDLDGNVAFQGTVDLTDSVARIRAGKTLERFRNDGITFENRERRLPTKPKGYYHEYVHPTPDLSGPGPQRIIAAPSGEMWYTHDHYRSFKKIIP